MALGQEIAPMNNVSLPGKRVLNSAFKEKGREDVVKIEVFPVSNGDVVKLTFESASSPWRQGVWLKTDDHLLVNRQQSPSVQLWQDTAPQKVLIECHTRNGCLHLYNIWDKGRGLESQSWTSGMLVDELPNGRRYRCNDIGFDTTFAKLVFRVEHV
jgi:hypothetical protein